jgi:hypothetical protein
VFVFFISATSKLAKDALIMAIRFCVFFNNL